MESHVSTNHKSVTILQFGKSVAKSYQFVQSTYSPLRFGLVEGSGVKLHAYLLFLYESNKKINMKIPTCKIVKFSYVIRLVQSFTFQ